MANFDIEALKSGKVLFRMEWYSTHIKLCKAKTIRDIIINGDDEKEYICMCSNKEKRIYIPNLDDLMADDWVVQDCKGEI